MLVPKGSAHDVAPTYGLAAVPAPLPPKQVTVGPENTNSSAPRMFPEFTSPLNAWTWSLRPFTVSVSCAVSATFRIWYEQLYGDPTFTGLLQPFENAIPWKRLCADALPTPNVSSMTQMTPATVR